MNFWKLKMKIEEESYNSRKKLKTQGKNSKLKEKTQNSRKKLNLRGAVSPPVSPSDVKKNACLDERSKKCPR